MNLSNPVILPVTCRSTTVKLFNLSLERLKHTYQMPDLDLRIEEIDCHYIALTLRTRTICEHDCTKDGPDNGLRSAMPNLSLLKARIPKSVEKAGYDTFKPCCTGQQEFLTLPETVVLFWMGEEMLRVSCLHHPRCTSKTGITYAADWFKVHQDMPKTAQSISFDSETLVSRTFHSSTID